MGAICCFLAKGIAMYCWVAWTVLLFCHPIKILQHSVNEVLNAHAW